MPIVNQTTFWTFLRQVGSNAVTLLAGGFSVLATACSVYFPTVPLKALCAFLAAIGLVWACYRVWRDSLIAAQATIHERDLQIEKLKHRSYDVEHLRIAQSKVNALTDGSRDLVYFLLHNGETEGEDLQRCCQNPTYFDEALQRPRNEKLIVAEARNVAGRSGVQYFWKINPQFQDVLQDLDLSAKREPRLFI